jgi:phytoene dehydrogenase-like protein
VNPVVVIGAGLAGLSAIWYLTGRGYGVTVVEGERLPGGGTGMLHRDGFTFETAPTALPGMFFAGSRTVQGVGFPMVLISGKLAASRVAAYLREPGR